LVRANVIFGAAGCDKKATKAGVHFSTIRVFSVMRFDLKQGISTRPTRGRSLGFRRSAEVMDDRLTRTREV
jgi:hypothetical protein